MSSSLKDQLARFDPDLPLERAHTIPSSWYFDPAIYEAERQTIFTDTWQAVGRGDQLTEPGSFFTANVAGEPIVVVRDQDGVVRALANVCRHRAAQVITEAEGKATRLRCRYHGWTYDLAGRLRGTPEFDGVADFCREEQGLPGRAVDTWGPQVWIHQGTQPPPLAQFLSPLPERCAGLGLESLRFAERRVYEMGCNWKVFIDNFLDGGYHVNTVHPGLGGVIDYARYRIEVFDQCSVQISPLRPPQADAADPSIAAVRSGSTAYYWWVFPNFMFNWYEGVADASVVQPLGPDRCRVIFDFYFTRTEGPEAAAFISQSIAAADQIQREDIGICEEVQRGLASRSYDTGRFSVKREAGGYHFHRLLAGRLRSAC
jgi:choline monooxygenase